MSEEDKDVLSMDQDTFVTKLALEILEGRSFDVTGKKCPYENLFNNIVPEEASEDEEEKEEETEPGPTEEEEEEDEEAAESKRVTDQAKKDNEFISKMLLDIDEEYQRLLGEEKARVRKFRETHAAAAFTIVEQISLYRRENHLDMQCKGILSVIQNLQNRFFNVDRLTEVTRNLERLSKMVTFEDVDKD